jgi:uncharacterized membrane protein YjgN (DUF898 family)
MSATDRVRAVNIASLAVLVLSLLLLAWFLASHSYRLQADDTVTSARMHFVYVPPHTQAIALTIVVALFFASLFIRLKASAAGNR